MKDYLGNNRLVLNEYGMIIQQNNYYPFGMSQLVDAEQQDGVPYKFSGKELESDGGLNWYDFSARFYDASTGRFGQIDPLCERYYEWSPYLYCGANPINRTDPTGMYWIEKGRDNYTWVENTTTTTLETSYVNKKGELLYRTDDGLDDIIIVPDTKIPELEKKLNEADKNGTIDDPETNKKKMHILGKTPQQYTDETLENMSMEEKTGYQLTYEKAYNNKSTFWVSVLHFFATLGDKPESGPSPMDIRRGAWEGENNGKFDRKNGLINRLNPYLSFKNNAPLIKLSSPKNNNNNHYNPSIKCRPY